VKYQTTARFDLARAKLPREHRRLFVDTVRGHLIPARAAGAHRGEAPWPKRPRVHKIGEIYSLTWSFAGPDGRTFADVLGLSMHDALERFGDSAI
jgi:hypothetical protein